jgi:hypothetical protein
MLRKKALSRCILRKTAEVNAQKYAKVYAQKRTIEAVSAQNMLRLMLRIKLLM